MVKIGAGIGPPGGSYSSLRILAGLLFRFFFPVFFPPSEVAGDSLTSCSFCFCVCCRCSSKKGWKGLLFLVRLWWTRLVLRRVVGCVGFVDVDGPIVSTLGSGASSSGLCNISVSCCRTFTCCLLWVALAGSSPCRICKRSAAAMMILSPSEMVGVLQCAGYRRNVPVLAIPPVLGSQKFRSL